MVKEHTKTFHVFVAKLLNQINHLFINYIIFQYSKRGAVVSLYRTIDIQNNKCATMQRTDN